MTLDKVTIHHKSYTVLLTFFFFLGSIYVMMKELFLIKSDSYDRRGTAAFVVKTLKETLGLTRTQLTSMIITFRSVVLVIDINGIVILAAMMWYMPVQPRGLMGEARWTWWQRSLVWRRVT